MQYPLDHVGIAVSNLEEAIESYAKGFGFRVHSREVVESQGVELAFIWLPNTKLELLSPIGGSGPVHKFLEKRGPGLHHLCYRVNDIRAELPRLKSLGYRLIDEEPRPGAENMLVAFIHPSSTGGVLTELCEPQK